MRETIAALASPQGTGAIAIIRISGDKSWEIAKRLSKIENPSPRKVYHSFLRDDGGEIDEVMITFYKAPKSYTGEDMVEICAHGGIVVSEMVLNAVLKNGARMAEPGEFTKRAFLNGKMDLTKAEAVRDLIEAKMEESARAIIRNVAGDLFKFLGGIREKLLDILAKIEVEIDYPDEEDLKAEGIPEDLERILVDLEDVIERSKKLLRISKGIRIVIVGKPNVGKSTLLNRLVGEEKAIVTHIPGTTRDLIEGEMKLKGKLFRIIDTAGLRETEDFVESIGVERAKKEMENANLILFVVDDTFSEEDLKIYDEISDKNHLVVVNKCDEDFKIDTSWVKSNVVRISAKTGMGLKDLKDLMLKMSGNVSFEGVATSSERQIKLLESSMESLKKALESSKSGYPNDVVSIDLNDALRFLDEITGRDYRQDLLETIFSSFCVGK